MSENRSSGNGEGFSQNDFVIDTRELTKSCQDLSESSQESFYNSPVIDQGYKSLLIHYTKSGICKDSAKISQQQQIVCLRDKTNYQSVITLNKKSRTELTWWIENLRF